MRTFRDYSPEERRNFITLSTGEYYPDILEDACRLYSPVLEMFSQLLNRSESSSALFMNIADVPTQWMRIQLCRVFRKYVSPETPVEMLKKKTQARKICEDFGEGFRPIHVVQEKFDARPMPDEEQVRMFKQNRFGMIIQTKADLLISSFLLMIRKQFMPLVLHGMTEIAEELRKTTELAAIKTVQMKY